MRVWVSPWYPSPLADGGYDVSDYRGILPEFGTLEQADTFVARAHELGMRVLIDLVPNHSSDEHAWFQAALAAAPGSAERDLYLFRDGLGENGDGRPTTGRRCSVAAPGSGPPTPTARRVSGTCTCSTSSSPTGTGTTRRSSTSSTRSCGSGSTGESTASGSTWPTRWPRPRVCPTSTSIPDTGRPVANTLTGSPYMNQPHVHDILRRWRTVADSYADSELGARVFVSEAWVTPAAELAKYVRADELHTTFNFDALMCEWSAESQRNVIDLTLAATGAVGAPPTWVLANHDTTRVVTRYGRPVTGARFTADGMDLGSFAGIGSVPEGATDVTLGRKRARAAVLLELALPGGAYVYQGDELGLEEVEDIPDELLQDPIWERSGHVVRGRDGCRVPIPWSGTEAPYGFGSADNPPWLPQPEGWAALTAEAQDGDPASHPEPLPGGAGRASSPPGAGRRHADLGRRRRPGVLSFTREPGFRCVVNFGPEPYALPGGRAGPGRLRRRRVRHARGRRGGLAAALSLRRRALVAARDLPPAAAEQSTEHVEDAAATALLTLAAAEAAQDRAEQVAEPATAPAPC